MRYHRELDHKGSYDTHRAADDESAPQRNPVKVQQLRTAQNDGEHVDGQRQGVEDGQGS